MVPNCEQKNVCNLLFLQIYKGFKSQIKQQKSKYVKKKTGNT